MLKKYLTSLLSSVDGCSAILVYDRNKESNSIFRAGELSENETNAIKHNIDVFNSSPNIYKELFYYNLFLFIPVLD